MLMVKRYDVISIDETGENTTELVDYLHQMRIDVKIARNEVEAYRALVAFNYKVDLIIWNIYVDPDAVFEKIKTFKSRSESKKIPIIIFSPLKSKEYIVKASLSGVSGYIIRPYNQEFVINKISSILGIKSENQEGVLPGKDVALFTLDDVITKEVKASGRAKYPLSLLMIRFEPNSSEISRMTSELLEVFIDVIKPKLRETDWIFEYNSESTIVILPFTDIPGAVIVKGKLQEIFSSNSIIKMQIKGYTFKLASVSSPEDGKNKTLLMEGLLEKIKQT